MSVIPPRMSQQRNDRSRRIVAGRFASAPILLLTAWSLVGCYAYVPVAPSQPAASDGSVRVTLTTTGAEYFKGSLGNNVRQIEGTVTRATPDTVVIAVERMFTSTRESFTSQGDTVAVPRQLTEELSLKQYSRKRSVLIAVAIVGSLVIALAGLANGASTSGDPQPGPIQP